MQHFPNAALYDIETKQKMKSSSAKWHSNNTKKLSEETKRKISLKAIGRKSGPRSEETKQKMRDAWVANKDSWSKSIKQGYIDNPERLEKIRDAARRNLSERSTLLNWKENAFERKIRETIEGFGYTVHRQKRTNQKLLGAYRFFDFFIQDLNLFVEVDGEYWHRKPGRYDIDVAKTQWARSIGEFMRISDSDKWVSIEALLNDKAFRDEYANCVLEKRLAYLTTKKSEIPDSP